MNTRVKGMLHSVRAPGAHYIYARMEGTRLGFLMPFERTHLPVPMLYG